jgi:hypothetical protein
MGGAGTGANRGAVRSAAGDRAAARPVDASRARVDPPTDRTAVVRNEAFANNARGITASDRAVNHAYWHNYNGQRFAHYQDTHHHHWYGFYGANAFYWTRYHNSHWWWHDPSYSAWVFYSNGYWWWQQPGGAMYVYRDGGYYPYDSEHVPVAAPSAVAAPTGEPPKEAPASAVVSADGSREVKIEGEKAEASLYDRDAEGKTTLRKKLGEHASEAAWTGSGKDLRLRVNFSDGRTAFFDKDGGEASAPSHH